MRLADADRVKARPGSAAMIGLMTTLTRVARRRGWVAAFLTAALASVLAVGVGLAGAGSASAVTTSTAQNRVGASHSTATVLVGSSLGITAGQQIGNSPVRHQIAVATGVAANTGDDLVRVGRWMSEDEFAKMSSSGHVIEGGSGRTYVTTPANPDVYPAGKGVFAEFDVPGSSVFPASKPEWGVIPGPNVTATRFGPPPAEMPPAPCIVLVCRR